MTKLRAAEQRVVILAIRLLKEASTTVIGNYAVMSVPVGYFDALKKSCTSLAKLQRRKP